MNSIISWVGGKRLLRKQIIPLIPKHQVYCEVFGGAGWILFGKSRNPADWGNKSAREYTEVYNDINGDLVNFWRYVRSHPEALVTELNQCLISREIFEQMLQQHPRTEMERAARFYYKLDCSYGSQSKNFCIMKGSKYLPLRFNESVAHASERLQNVIIEQMDFVRLIERYDAAETFFYLDPPYYKHEHLYKRDDAVKFTRHDELAAILHNIKGKFLLSYNDHEYVRELYKDCDMMEVPAQYSVSGGRTQEIELLIKNF
jgi:DNA adenine methylase